MLGSSLGTKYEYQDGKPVLFRLPKVFFIDDHDGKASGINLFIGKRPQVAFGNSAGDREMLEWTTAGGGAQLGLLVHHDDPKREYAYAPAGGSARHPRGHISPVSHGRSQKARLGDHLHEEGLEKGLCLGVKAPGRKPVQGRGVPAG